MGCYFTSRGHTHTLYQYSLNCSNATPKNVYILLFLGFCYLPQLRTTRLTVLHGYTTTNCVFIVRTVQQPLPLCLGIGFTFPLIIFYSALVLIHLAPTYIIYYIILQNQVHSRKYCTLLANYGTASI